MNNNDDKGMGAAMPAILETLTNLMAYRGIKPGVPGWYELLNCSAAAAEEYRRGNIPAPNWIVMDFAKAAGTTQLNAWQRMRRALAAAGWEVTVSQAIRQLGSVGCLYQ